MHLRPIDRTTVILGANATRLQVVGSSYGTDESSRDSKITPHLGLMVDLSANISVYASHTGIFSGQYEVDENRQRLKPVTGQSNELGLKSDWLGKRLLATVAVFRSQQNNLATFASTADDGTSLYTGEDVRSQGIELELSGQVLPGWSVNGGYTRLAIHDADGASTRLYTPRQQFQLNTTWLVPQVQGLKLGAQMSWQSAIEGGGIRQGAYALLSLMASYRIDDHWTFSAQLDNVTDKSYYTSLYWTQSFYGEPRHGTVSLNWKF